MSKSPIPAQDEAVVFDRERAAAYDGQYAKLAPLREAIHLLLRVLFSDLPAAARILCVGVGTGAELIDLALAFPAWQFTAVEPAAPMLALCRQRAADYGVAARCTFHEGYLDTLPTAPAFDAATCLLVSHFLVRPDDQRALFAQIAARLRPGGYFVNSAIASDRGTAAYQSLLAVWLQMQRYTGVSEEAVAKMLASYGRDIAVLPPAEIEAMIAESGFEEPVRFYQALLIHAWYAKLA